MEKVLRILSDDWFLREPALFALYCQQQLQENARMECAVRCGQGRIEYNPLILHHKNYSEVEQLMRIELIRLFLKHPYERLPEGCSHEAVTIGSDITIADGYCLLHKEKLPLKDPTFYHLPLGQYYEWYAKQIQQQQNDDSDNRNRNNNNESTEQQNNEGKDQQKNERTKQQKNTSAASQSQLWREDSVERQKINELIERTTDWGTLPSDVVERIQASTKARIPNRLIWQGFHSAILSSKRHLTRMRPNRRTGFQQMGSTRQFDTHMLVAIDVSGSITNTVLENFFSSVNRLFRYGIVQIDVCQFDAELGPIVPMQRAQQEVTVKGRGGTSFQPLFDMIQDNKTLYDGLIILTDGQAPPPSVDKPRIPVLWVCQDKAAYDAYSEWMKKTGRCCHL